MELKAGQVFHLWCRACNPQKNKFFVLASINPGPWFFLINSDPTEFQKKRPHLMASLLSIEVAAARFLHHDSWLDCTQLMGGHSAQDLETLLVAQSNDYKGRLGAGIRRRVRAIIAQSTVLTQFEKTSLLLVW